MHVTSDTSGFSSPSLQPRAELDVLWHLRNQILRLVLDGTQTHTYLKKVVLTSLVVDLKAQRMKGYFDVALVSLLEEGLLERCGSGNWARYAVPAGMIAKAESVAYKGFEEECDNVIDVVVQSSGGTGLQQVSVQKRDLSLSPLRVCGSRGIKKRKRRSFCSSVPMSP